MKRREKMKWRWELEGPKKEIIVPTRKERSELGLTDEEWILICYIKYKNSKCFRETHAHKLCDLCPKSGKVKIDEGQLKEIETSLAKIMRKLARKRR